MALLDYINQVSEVKYKKETHPKVAWVFTILFIGALVSYNVRAIYEVTKNVDTSMDPANKYIYHMTFVCECQYGCLINAWSQCTLNNNHFKNGSNNVIEYGDKYDFKMCASSSDYVVFAANSNATIVDSNGNYMYQLLGHCVPSIKLTSDFNFRTHNTTHIGVIVNSVSIDLTAPWSGSTVHGVTDIFPNIVKDGTDNYIYNYVSSNSATPVIFNDAQSIPCYSIWKAQEISECLPVRLQPLVSITTTTQLSILLIISMLAGTYSLISYIFILLAKIARCCLTQHEKSNNVPLLSLNEQSDAKI